MFFSVYTYYGRISGSLLKVLLYAYFFKIVFWALKCETLENFDFFPRDWIYLNFFMNLCTISTIKSHNILKFKSQNSRNDHFERAKFSDLSIVLSVIGKQSWDVFCYTLSSFFWKFQFHIYSSQNYNTLLARKY